MTFAKKKKKKSGHVTGWGSDLFSFPLHMFIYRITNNKLSINLKTEFYFDSTAKIFLEIYIYTFSHT